MIASSGAADVLRNSWNDAAAALAPDLPDLPALLGGRLDQALSTGGLDESELLAAVDDVVAAAEGAGSPGAGVLGRRLRRTVYEYLLALDASAAIEGQAAMAATEAEAHPAVAHIALAAPPALSDAAPSALSEPPTAEPPIEDAHTHDQSTEHSDSDEAQAPRRFGLWRRHPAETASPTASAEESEASLGETEPSRAWAPSGDVLPEPPMWSFRQAVPEEAAEPEPAAQDAVEPADVDHGEETPEPGPVLFDEPAGTSVPAPSWYLDRSEPPVVQPETIELAVPENGEAATGSTDDFDAADELPPPEAMTPAVDDTDPAHDQDALLAEQRAPEDGAPEDAPPEEAVPAEAAAPIQFVAPRDGFHIVDGAAPVDEALPAAASRFAVFSLEDAAAAAAPAAANADERLRVFRSEGDAETPATSGAPAGNALAAFDDDFDEDDRGPWRVRDGGANGSRSADADSTDDPFAQDVNLEETRRRIQERLRRKRCDEAAAMLQSLAQDTGGRAVAELAMDAGDRCRALGKANAALNCYLAASRSDPVFELPLSRLADICIDDQDIELAVSYLERIARLARMRGDERAALRVYRRIATVAPYREDILALLMNAHSVGRLDP